MSTTLDMEGIAASISFFCFLSLVLASVIGHYLVSLRYELFFLYYIAGFGPILIHRLGHTRIWALWFKQHVIHHHIKMYPAKRFEAPAPYRNTLPWTSNGNVLNFTIPSFLVCFVVTSTWAQAIYVLACVSLILARENYMHEQIHLKDSRWGQTRWLQCLKAVHFIHHSGNMNKNFGFVDLFFDFCMGTLELPPSTPGIGLTLANRS